MTDINKLYTKRLLDEIVYLKFNNITDNNFYAYILNILKTKEGKCIEEGYIKLDSIKIITLSMPSIISDKLKFNVVYECLVAIPSNNMLITCNVKNITKVGIRAELDINPTPYIIFLARDHHYNNESFNNISEGEKINIKVLAFRFELNDTFISIIAELLDKKGNIKQEFRNLKTEKTEKKVKKLK
tara:strand:- start:372 stop:929 length:558 start_codon:yes stop_codon:yes gene_type:complete